MSIILLWWNSVAAWTCFNARRNKILNRFLEWEVKKGHSKTSRNLKWSCLPHWRVTERALSDAGESQASTQPPDRTSLICRWSRGGRSDKGQGFGCDKEGPYVPLLAPALTLAVRCERPSKGQEPNTARKASRMVFSHTGMTLTPCCQIYRMLVCIYMW